MEKFYLSNIILRDSKTLLALVGIPLSGELHNCGRCRLASVSRGGPWLVCWLCICAVRLA